MFLFKKPKVVPQVHVTGRCSDVIGHAKLRPVQQYNNNTELKALALECSTNIEFYCSAIVFNLHQGVVLNEYGDKQVSHH